MQVTLIQANKLKSALNNLLSKKLSITLSLAYYSLVQGNTAPLKDFPQEITQDLDRNTRQFICAKFDSKNNQWTYNKSKAEKLCAELNIVFQKTTFEDFCTAINTKLETKVEPAPVDFDKRGRTQITNAVKSLQEAGLTDTQILAILKDTLIKSHSPATLKTAA